MAASIAILLAASLAEPSAFAEEAVAQNGPAALPVPPDDVPPGEPAQEEAPPPIPPYVDGPAVPAAGGGYCFEGPHPVDSGIQPGITWDSTPGRHVHAYPPFDLRLFNFDNGCYYFIGDPTDFGYVGTTYGYYGAHPILPAYGGGWCFMVGPHRHFWRPWSPLFVTVGPWYYWEGPYDPFFWTYWPFYHYYYRTHYSQYYAHGAFFRGHRVAPRITSVPRPQRYGGAWHGAGGSHPGRPMPPRGTSPAPAGMGRAAPMAPRGRAPAPGGGIAPRSLSTPRTGGAHFGGGHMGGRGRR